MESLKLPRIERSQSPETHIWVEYGRFWPIQFPPSKINIAFINSISISINTTQFLHNFPLLTSRFIIDFHVIFIFIICTWSSFRYLLPYLAYFSVFRCLQFHLVFKVSSLFFKVFFFLTFYYFQSTPVVRLPY